MRLVWRMEIWDDDGAHSLGQKQSDQRILQRNQRSREALGSSVEYEDSYRRAKRRIISQITEAQTRPKSATRPPNSGRARGVAEVVVVVERAQVLVGQWGRRTGNFTRHASCMYEVISRLSQRANRIRVKEREAERAQRARRAPRAPHVVKLSKGDVRLGLVQSRRAGLLTDHHASSQALASLATCLCQPLQANVRCPTRPITSVKLSQTPHTG